MVGGDSFVDIETCVYQFDRLGHASDRFGTVPCTCRYVAGKVVRRTLSANRLELIATKAPASLWTRVVRRSA